MSTGIYYDGGPVLSYKRYISFVIGSRGVGKTYFFKNLCLKSAIKSREVKFVWVRRYLDDIKALKNNFFRDIEGAFPDYEFSADVEALWCRDKGTTAWFQIGSFIPLSAYERYKGNSFHTVEYLIFDEFITAGRYLTEEVFKFYDLCETVFRDRAKMRAILLANALSQLNPYFDAFHIKLTDDNEFLAADKWVAQNVDAHEFIEHKKETPMGHILEGTDYQKYSMDNQFILDDTSDIVSKPKGAATSYSNLVLHGIHIGVWLMNGGVWFGEPNETSTDYTIYVPDSRESAAILLDKNGKLVKFISKMYKENKVLGFLNMTIKQEVLNVAILGIKNYRT